MMKRILIIAFTFIFIFCGCNLVKSKDNSEPLSDVSFLIDYQENLVLNKYDVKVFVDSKEIATIKQGEKQIYQTSISQGEHKLKLVDTTDNENKYETTISVGDSPDLCFYLSCKAQWDGINSIDFKPITLTEANDIINPPTTTIPTYDIETVPEITKTTAKKVESICLTDPNEYQNLSLKLSLNGSCQVKYFLKPFSANTDDIIIVSENPDILSIEASDGKYLGLYVKALKRGETVLYIKSAYDDSIISEKLHVTVY